MSAGRHTPGQLGATIRGCRDMLRESAKQFRLLCDNGHAKMCDLHADNADSYLWSVEPNEYALLAAAPDLLSALERVLELSQEHNAETGFYSPPCPYQLADIARAAIRRARGE